MLRLIFWTIVLILFLSFFGISIQGLVENPTTQTNFQFILSVLHQGWDTIWSWITGVITQTIDFFTIDIRRS